MFSKKQKNNTRRARQPVAPGTTIANRAVFSYHAANRAADQDANVGPRSVKWLWANPTTKSSPRRSPWRWLRRVPRTVMLLLVAALLISNLILGRTPTIITLAETRDRQVLLRDQASYQTAANTILQSSLANSTKLTINTASIESQLRRQFPEIERVSVTLPIIGRQPTVYIQPARPALLLKLVDGGLFVVGTSGRALMAAPDVKHIEKLGLVVVEDQTGLPVQPGKSALPSSDVSFITEVIGQLQAKKLTATGMTLLKGTNQLDVRLEGVSYFVKFNLRGDARAEVGAYLATKQHLERDHKVPGSYIDVRVDNRVYYK